MMMIVSFFVFDINREQENNFKPKFKKFLKEGTIQ